MSEKREAAKRIRLGSLGRGGWRPLLDEHGRVVGRARSDEGPALRGPWASLEEVARELVEVDVLVVDPDGTAWYDLMGR